MIRYIDFHLEKIKIIPLNLMPTRIFTIAFEGWNSFTLTMDDKNFSEFSQMASKTFKSFVSLYQKTHVFTEPQLIWTPDGISRIKIGILPIEEYETRTNQEKIENVRKKNRLQTSKHNRAKS